MAISPQQLKIYLTSAHRAVIFAIAQLSCFYYYWLPDLINLQKYHRPISYFKLLDAQYLKILYYYDIQMKSLTWDYKAE